MVTITNKQDRQERRRRQSKTKPPTNTGFNQADELRLYREIHGPDFQHISDDDLDPEGNPYDFDNDPDNDDWYTETTNRRKVKDQDHRFLCITCKHYLRYSRNGSYTCFNNRCVSYLSPADPFNAKLPVKSEGGMSMSESLVNRYNNNDVFVGWNPDSGEFSGDNIGQSKTVEYKDDKKRIAHVRYRGFPESLALKDNS